MEVNASNYAAGIRPLTILWWILAVFALTTRCDRTKPSDFVAIRADRIVSGSSAYPVAIDPSHVGLYEPETKSGAGYFYDDVLEYRVWLHPEDAAAPLAGTGDYFVAFAQFERAEAFAKSTKGAEPPLVLVRQLEWIDEPEPRHYVAKKAVRLTEWRVRWLKGNKRNALSIQGFLRHPVPVDK
jgi:hypothetical protein